MRKIIFYVLKKFKILFNNFLTDIFKKDLSSRENRANYALKNQINKHKSDARMFLLQATE